VPEPDVGAALPPWSIACCCFRSLIGIREVLQLAVSLCFGVPSLGFLAKDARPFAKKSVSAESMVLHRRLLLVAAALRPRAASVGAILRAYPYMKQHNVTGVFLLPTV